MFVLVPTTELEAVNSMLMMIGEQPVLSLDAPGFMSASLARSMLNTVSRAVQGQSLHCNTEKNYTLPLNSYGEIPVPSNVLNVDTVDTSINVAVRGGKLYDLDNHTFKFTTSLDVDIIFFLPFEDLPEHVRRYVTIIAGRRFIVQTIGAVDLYKMTGPDEEEAMVNFKRMELRNIDTTLNSSMSITGILNR